MVMEPFIPLDVYYSSQYVSGECQDYNPEYLVAERTPILPGTVAGSVFLEDQEKASQTFVFSASGVLTLTDNIAWVPRIIKGSINYITGEMNFEWDKVPKKAKFVLNYEYNMECCDSQPPEPTTVTLIAKDKDDYMIVLNDNKAEVELLPLQKFSPLSRMEGTPVYYRVLCYGVEAEQLAMIASRLYAVNARFDVFGVDVPKGYGSWMNRDPFLKPLFSNDPQQPKPNFIDHAKETAVPYRCPATDS